MIEIREMQFDDLDQVIPIEEANFTTPWTANGFFTFLLREDARFLVAEEDGEIVGYCGVILTPPESDITNVCVVENCRRKGIAEKLILQLKTDLLNLGVQVIHLEVRKSNTPAITLYEKLGFSQDGLRPHYYESPTEDAVLMSCTMD